MPWRLLPAVIVFAVLVVACGALGGWLVERWTWRKRRRYATARTIDARASDWRWQIHYRTGLQFLNEQYPTDDPPDPPRLDD